MTVISVVGCMLVGLGISTPIETSVSSLAGTLGAFVGCCFLLMEYKKLGKDE